MPHSLDAFENGTAEYAVQMRVILEFLAKGLFFIGGVPKSGSTWLQVMLNEHPDIACTGEGHLANHLGPALESAMGAHNQFIYSKHTAIFSEFPPFPSLEFEHHRFFLRSAIALLLMRSDGARSARVIGEKTPENVTMLPVLESLFPHTKFLHIVRDGRDCAVSAWFHNMRVAKEALENTYATFGDFLKAFAAIWANKVSNGLQLCAERPGRAKIVRYKDLLQQPEIEIASIFSFLGVGTADRIVRNCIAGSTFEKMSGGRRPGQEDRDSFMRRGETGDWRNHLTPAENAAFLAIAGEVLDRLGFTP